MEQTPDNKPLPINKKPEEKKKIPKSTNFKRKLIFD